MFGWGWMVMALGCAPNQPLGDETVDDKQGPGRGEPLIPCSPVITDSCGLSCDDPVDAAEEESAADACNEGCIEDGFESGALMGPPSCTDTSPCVPDLDSGEGPVFGPTESFGRTLTFLCYCKGFVL